MDNITIASVLEGVSDSPHVYTANEITLMLGGLGGMVASLIYAMKNVNHLKSGCCECDQKVATPKWSFMKSKEPVVEQPVISAVSNV